MLDFISNVEWDQIYIGLASSFYYIYYCICAWVDLIWSLFTKRADQIKVLFMTQFFFSFTIQLAISTSFMELIFNSLSWKCINAIFVISRLKWKTWFIPLFGSKLWFPKGNNFFKRIQIWFKRLHTFLHTFKYLLRFMVVFSSNFWTMQFYLRTWHWFKF